jgi:hypothetical protein
VLGHFSEKSLFWFTIFAYQNILAEFIYVSVVVHNICTPRYKDGEEEGFGVQHLHIKIQ